MLLSPGETTFSRTAPLLKNIGQMLPCSASMWHPSMFLCIGDCDNAYIECSKSKVTEGNVTAKASIDIICTTCYVKAKAAVQLTVDGNFNATAAFKNVGCSLIS